MPPPLRRLRIMWRRLLRQERPRQALVRWGGTATGTVVLVVLSVGLLSSWPWLVEPSLRPTLPAPFTVRAPRDATVVDSSALERRLRQQGQGVSVQVVDETASLDLRRQLDQRLAQLEQTLASPQRQLDPLQLTDGERTWLRGLDADGLSRWQREVRQAQLRMLSQGVVAQVSEGQLLQAASLQLENQPLPGRRLGSRLLAASLYGATNLRQDPILSQRRLDQLIRQQGIPTLTVRQGDLITRQGEPITPEAFDVLDSFGLVNRRPRPLAWLAHLLEAMAVSAVMLLVMRRWRASLEPRQALLALLMLLVVQAAKLSLGPLVSPMALLLPPTLLLAQGLGTVPGLAWLASAALLWPQPPDGALANRLLAAAALAAAAAVLGGRQRTRADLLRLALLLPGAVLVLAWLFRPPVDPVAETMLVASLLLGGVLLAPLVESFFGLLPPTRLRELADLELPLLRRLSREAPGTFEHTLMITGLAEEGARAIHADVDLIRTGALYHDVGKLHAPQWFIENQDGGPNPHDQLANPAASATILQAHVDEGLKLARRYHLPRPLADFIPEHQGTLRMGYFLHQARLQDPTVGEEPFRYRGPIPRSRETAILMLADGCEAALRALPPDTDSRQADDVVRRIVEARRRDGQLANSGLGRAELDLVIQAFVRVWKRMRHRRIPYPIPAGRGEQA
ncbi:MAG: HDIG domain-containing protein [Cyanobacteriota bacterium]|nr:HDIG domain-containing protein [Cyanobacteriota bacterium]